MTIRARNDTKEIEKERKKSGISFLRAVNVPKEIHKWIHKRAKEKSARKSSRGSRVKPGIFFNIRGPPTRSRSGRQGWFPRRAVGDRERRCLWPTLRFVDDSTDDKSPKRGGGNGKEGDPTSNPTARSKATSPRG